jgi:hypothetical protein
MPAPNAFPNNSSYGGPETEEEEDVNGGFTGAPTLSSSSSVPLHESLKMGDVIDVMDSRERWCEGEVLKVDRINWRVLVSYVNWDSKFDEWVSDPLRLAPLHMHTYTLGGILQQHQRVEVLDEIGKWLEAFVIEESGEQVKVHFMGFSYKYDCWLTRGSNRIRPFSRPKHAQRGKQKWKVPGAWVDKGMSKRMHLDIDVVPSSSSSSGPPGGGGADPNEERTRKIAQMSQQFEKYRDALAKHQLCIGNKLIHNPGITEKLILNFD